MSRHAASLVATFEAYGPDEADDALAAYAQTDPDAWSAYVDTAAARRWKADRRGWLKSQVAAVEREAIAATAADQPRLFEVAPVEGVAQLVLRERLVLDGEEFDLGRLSGLEGAKIVRKVAERDLTPALTTVVRSRQMLQLAEHVTTESERLGRDVTFGEVLGWVAA